MIGKLKWNRIGYTEGKLKWNDRMFIARAILYVRPPFLWFETRKVVYIGDYKRIQLLGTSEHCRTFELSVDDWLRGGKIDYVSESGNGRSGEIIRLVKT